MRHTTYTQFKPDPLDRIDLGLLLEHLSDFLMDGGFAGGPNYHPWWGWSGDEDTRSLGALKDAILSSLLATGQMDDMLFAEITEWTGDEREAVERMDHFLDDLIERLIDEGYLVLEPTSQPGGGVGFDPEGVGGEVRDPSVDSDAPLGMEYSLTRKGMDFLGYRALRTLLGSVGRRAPGVHDTPRLDTGIEAGAASRPYQFGDTLNLDVSGTLRNALEREGPGVPLDLRYGDLMVHQTEHRASCATVLMLDVSHSMVLYGEDRFSPAKRVALALSHLIRTRYPGDTLRVVTFGDRAHEIPLSQLGRAQVGPYHTNTAEGFELARRILGSERHELRQIIMITDGKPSAMTLEGGRVYTNSGGLDPRILKETYSQAAACRKAGILINTFMLARDPYLMQFVHELSGIARGKAYFTSPDTLGEYVMMDFMKGKGGEARRLR